MPRRISFDAFSDPARRPRAILWTATGLMAVVAVMVIALGVTSTYWFCANGCHKVQDDTITAYNMSSHAKVSCMACHMPVGADPITFVFHKAEALGELYLTVSDNFELPLNAASHVAEEMDPGQCTQCHGPNREFTPGSGIIIDHDIHEANGVACTICHNRVAHPEEFELTLADNRKHEDFMDMEACFRCHGLEEGAQAPGACAACHPEDFELKPANHLEPAFYEEGGDSKGHAELKKAEPDYCRICHAEATFCSDCHGLAMPHPADFREGHGQLGKSKPAICANCHAKGAKADQSSDFCNACHHGAEDSTEPWIDLHFRVVAQTGASACFECHESTYCADCHVSGL